MAELHHGTESYQEPTQEPKSGIQPERPRHGTEKLSYLVQKAMQDTELAYKKATAGTETPPEATEDVLQRAVEAAKDTKITEVQIERRHEVKDAPGQQPAAKQSISAASAPSPTPTHTSAYEDSSTHSAEPQNGLGTIWQGFIHNNTLYGQAIRYGVFSAVLALISAIIVTLVISQ